MIMLQEEFEYHVTFLGIFKRKMQNFRDSIVG